MNSTAKKSLKIVGLSILLAVLLLLLVVLSYVAYLSVNYYRIRDYQTLAINNNKTEQVALDTAYTISTYNIGFGAYNHEFDFFMDSGTMKDGTKVSGSGSKAKDQATVLTNMNGALDVIYSLNTDFSFFQEVDVKADRSRFVDEYAMIQQKFIEHYSSSIAMNMHCGYLLYPFNDPHGSVQAGQVTLSRYAIDSATRRSFPIDESFINKFFDLDRCFVVNRLKIQDSDKELVLINLHMSAYDEGGKVRARQLEMLTDVIESEYKKGNYVIAGGDWNHDIAGSLDAFESQQEVPDWVQQITTEDIPEGFSFATTLNAPTCRSTDMPYTAGVNYTVVVDGFLVSSNVQVNMVENINTDFAYSDHNPVLMSFSLVKPETPPEGENPDEPTQEVPEEGTEDVETTNLFQSAVDSKKKEF